MIDIHIHGGTRYANRIETEIRRAHRMLRSPVRELSVALVDDSEMIRLHEQFLGIAEPTDVLSFELETDRRGKVISGEVVIDLDHARRSAKMLKNKLGDELLLYALHGLLHLSGHDDRTPQGYRRMHRMEDQILVKLGIGRVFAPGKNIGRGF